MIDFKRGLSRAKNRSATRLGPGTSLLWRSRRLALVVAAILCAGVLFAPPALASGRPIIENLTASARYETMMVGFGGEIAVDANIDPEGLETTYETWPECALCGTNFLYTEGSLPAVDEVRAVTLTLHDLQPGGNYWVSLRVRNAAGEAFQRSDDVVVPESPGSFPDGTAPVEVVRAPYLVTPLASSWRSLNGKPENEANGNSRNKKNGVFGNASRPPSKWENVFSEKKLQPPRSEPARASCPR